MRTAIGHARGCQEHAKGQYGRGAGKKRDVEQTTGVDQVRV